MLEKNITEYNYIGENIELFDPKSKVWVFISKNNFSNRKDELVHYLSEFQKNWESHGKIVKSNIHFLDNHIIVLIADPEGSHICGRAQDFALKIFDELGIIFETEFTNPFNIAYYIDNKLYVENFNNIKEKVKNKEYTDNTIFVNNMVNNLADYQSQLKIPIYESWLNN